jgi:acyl carrier protein
MGDSDMREKIRKYLTQTFIFDEKQQLVDDQSLLESGVLDSTGVLELIGWIETEFEIQFIDSELVAGNLDSIDRIIDFINRKRAL